MKLWVDDIRNAPDDTWTVARTVTSALRALRLFSNYITVVSLDHDISHQVTVGSLGRPYPCEETYMAVAYYLAQMMWAKRGQNDEDWNPVIRIHSSNVVAGEEMQRILEEAGFATIEHEPMGIANRLEMEV